MGRQKKIKPIQQEENTEAVMSDELVLDSVQTEIDLSRVELEKIKVEIAEKKLQSEQVGRRDLDPQEVAIRDKQITNFNKKAIASEIVEKQRAYDSEMITGRFMNRRAPGQAVKLPYHKYADDPVKWYPFEDGKTYTVPRGFADQINGGTDEDPCYYTPQFTQKEGAMDPNAPSSQVHSVNTSHKKYAFVPINF